MFVRDQQAHKGDSDCDGRKQNPSSTLPVLHHRSSSLFSIPIFRLFRLRMYNGKMKPFGYGWPMWTSIAMWCVIEIYWDMAKKNIAPETDSESRRSRWLHLL
jgi:hypothetical protein